MNNELNIFDNKKIEEIKEQEELLKKELNGIRNYRIAEIINLRKKLEENNQRINYKIQLLTKEIQTIKKDQNSIMLSIEDIKQGTLIFISKSADNNIKEIEKELEELKLQIVYDIDSLISRVYEENICNIFGHEYTRDEDSVAHKLRGGSFAEYTDNWYADERELISLAVACDKSAKCKYCGKKIEEQIQYPLDYKEKQKTSIINISKQKKKK